MKLLATTLIASIFATTAFAGHKHRDGYWKIVEVEMCQDYWFPDVESIARNKDGNYVFCKTEESRVWVPAEKRKQPRFEVDEKLLPWLFLFSVIESEKSK